MHIINMIENKQDGRALTGLTWLRSGK
jgi:hypothetical protein